MSMNVDNVVKQADAFITSSDEKSVRDIPSDNQIREIASKEAASVEGRLNINANGHTSDFNSKFLLPHIETTAAWLRKANEHENELTNAIGSLGTTHFSSEIDNLERQSSQAVENLKLKHRKDTWGQRAEERDSAAKNYKAMLVANDYKPPRKLPFWYWLVLIMIGSGEWLINFDTFAAKFAVQAMAIGMTLLVAFSFAAASHFHGEFIKQRPFLFSEKISAPVKNSHLMFQLVSLILFIASFAAVILVRYQVVQDELSLGGGVMALPGEAVAAQQTAFELVLPTIFLNLAVYLLGVVVSYALHDPIPGYQTAKNDLDTANQEFAKIDNELHVQQEAIEDKFHNDIRALQVKIKTIEDQAQNCKQMLQRLRSAISSTKNRSIKRLNSMSDNYRVQLATALRDLEKGELLVGPSNLSLADYLQKDISVKGEIFDEHV